jgi:EmrB/QacA subfamily drug resistance transporter
MTVTVEAGQAATPVAARRWLGLFAILAATLMNLLDTSIVNVALPDIRRDLGGSYSAMQWIVASYALVLAMGLITGGRLGDMFGRRRMLLTGAAGFVAASVSCALAQSPEMMIGSRVLQGAFGAVMIPQCFGLIRDLFPSGEDQAKAWGIFGPSIGLASILGPVVSGLLIKADLFGTDWRMIFFINVPLGAFALVAGRASLPRPTGDRTGGLDVIGMLTAAAGMGLLVYPLVQGREQGWPAWILTMPVVSVIVLAAFAVRQVRRQGSGRMPLVRLSVFAHRSYTSGVLFVIVFFASIVGFALSFGLMLQLGLGFTPIGASLAMITWAVGAFVGSATGSMLARLGRRILHLGLSLMALGTAGVYAVLAASGTGISAWQTAFPLLVCGAGMGMIFVPLFGIIMGEIEDHEVGSASGTLESVQQLASALGVAALGTVFFNRFTASAHTLHAVRANAIAAAEQVTLITLGLLVVAILVGFLLPRQARQG